MKRCLLSLLASCFALSMMAQFDQTARQEIDENMYLAASNFLDYNRQLTQKPLTPSPKGYEPYYFSSYARHGSRYLCGDGEYRAVLKPLRAAKEQGKLTAKGLHLLDELEAFYKTTYKRPGDLTPLGQIQHHGIAKRMVQNFPEIFKHKNLKVDARSTIVRRVMISMTAECEELAAANPTIQFHNDASEALQFYLGASWSKAHSRINHLGDSIRNHYEYLIQPDRLMGEIFNDATYVRDSIKANNLMMDFFYWAMIMQSHNDTDTEFLSWFTKDEIYDLWRYNNIDWYLGYSNAPATKGLMCFTQLELFKNFIETADTITQTGATLRFGHETCLMPLACLMELGLCATRTTDMDHLEQMWRNYRIFPMGGNVQLIFYRPKNGKQGDILVKALLNEREMSLPVATDQHPYYRWSDLRQHYLDRIAWFEEEIKKY